MIRVVSEKKALLLRIGKWKAYQMRECGHICSAPLRDRAGKCCACRTKAKVCLRRRGDDVPQLRRQRR